MRTRNFHKLPKFSLFVVGVFLTFFGFGQTKTDADLHASWSAKSKPDMMGIETYYMKFNKIVLL